ncbi:hypothetical protein GF338_02050 [candidate division WOR-3 bacterium]|nr:hypothetical protein [candidate division WOR-3 bacterium]
MKLRIRASKAYGKWFEKYSTLLRYFVTVAFPYDLSVKDARGKGIRLWRMTNEIAIGPRFREDGKGLITAFTIEGEVRPHIHLLQEGHPNLTEEVYDRICRRHLYVGGSKKAVKTILLKDIEHANTESGYISKDLTWDNSPYRSFIYVPKTSRN